MALSAQVAERILPPGLPAGLTVLNFIRSILLFVSLTAAGFAWVHTAKPQWISRVDAWICARHIQGTQTLCEQIRATDSNASADRGRMLETVQDHLTNLDPIQFGDRRLKTWLELVRWVVAEHRGRTNLNAAATWQARLVEVVPNNVREQLVLVDILLKRGHAADLRQAEAVLAPIRRKLPKWKSGATMEQRLRRAWARDPLGENR